LVHVVWGESATFTVAQDVEPRYPAFDLGSVVGDPDAEARDWLRSQIEEALGSPLDSASWLRPELLAAWIW